MAASLRCFLRTGKVWDYFRNYFFCIIVMWSWMISDINGVFVCVFRMLCQLWDGGSFTGALRPLCRSVLAASRLTVQLTVRLLFAVCLMCYFSCRVQINDTLHLTVYVQIVVIYSEFVTPHFNGSCCPVRSLS